MDLPKVGGSASAFTPQTRGAEGGVRLTSGISPAEGTTSATAARRTASTAVTGLDRKESFTPVASYGRDPEYRWLRGRLEYSQIDRRWKLRYIPVDGETDDFGGSVVLAKESLAGVERGDFVEVHGKLAGRPKGDTGYAPLYEVTQIKRLGN